MVTWLLKNYVLKTFCNQNSVSFYARILQNIIKNINGNSIVPILIAKINIMLFPSLNFLNSKIAYIYDYSKNVSIMPRQTSFIDKKPVLISDNTNSLPPVASTSASYVGHVSCKGKRIKFDNPSCSTTRSPFL